VRVQASVPRSAVLQAQNGDFKKTKQAIG